MLKDRSVLNNLMNEKIVNIAENQDLCNSVYDICFKKYNIPRGMTSDLLAMRFPVVEAEDVIVYAILDAIEQVNEEESIIPVFFSPQEIERYSYFKYKKNKIKFPIEIKMIQVEEDQWIGAISLDTLMQLRDAQLIFYNTDTQRPMKKVNSKNGFSYYVITLWDSAVQAISSLLLNKKFIPNTLTLNIRDEAEANYSYDPDTCTFIINSIDRLDIIDGYHRYIAICRAKDTDPNFDYTTELRIVNFSRDKAHRFIFQEDKKTKMRKIDSDAFDMDNAANRVVSRLNESSSFNLQGEVGKNDSLIPSSELAVLVKYFYFKNVRKEQERIVILRAVKELIENFNLLTEQNMEYLNKRYTWNDLLSIMFCFDYLKGKDKTKMADIIKYVTDKVNAAPSKKFVNKIPRKSLMDELERYAKEAEACIMKS